MTKQLQRDWLYETGMFETLSFELSDGTFYWYRRLPDNGFILSDILYTGDYTKFGIVRCKYPT